jgi:hypothetical protein
MDLLRCRLLAAGLMPGGCRVLAQLIVDAVVAALDANRPARSSTSHALTFVALEGALRRGRRGAQRGIDFRQSLLRRPAVQRVHRSFPTRRSRSRSRNSKTSSHDS